MTRYTADKIQAAVSVMVPFTKLFIVGAGFFHAMPLGYILRNSLDQMLIEGTPLETGHGKRCRCIPVLLMGFEFGERDRAQTGIEVQAELGL